MNFMKFNCIDIANSLKKGDYSITTIRYDFSKNNHIIKYRYVRLCELNIRCYVAYSFGYRNEYYFEDYKNYNIIKHSLNQIKNV